MNLEKSCGSLLEALGVKVTARGMDYYSFLLTKYQTPKKQTLHGYI